MSEVKKVYKVCSHSGLFGLVVHDDENVICWGRNPNETATQQAAHMTRIAACLNAFEGIDTKDIQEMPSTVIQLASTVNVLRASLSTLVSAYKTLRYMENSKPMSSGEDVALLDAKSAMYKALSIADAVLGKKADTPFGGPFIQFAGRCDRKTGNPPVVALGPIINQDGPGEEDGPWAEGWEQRVGVKHEHN